MDYQIIEDPDFVRLQFSKEWIEVGIITSENFALIKKEYMKGEDHRTEHYRWGAFRAFLEANKFIPPEKFYILYKLGKNDPDYSMGRAMIFDIIKRLDCPQELLDTAINDSDLTLAKYALKCKAIRDKSKLS
ncbi:hypothetical protein [Chlorogloeopsis sp. ULAP02]|uniref:hypothetical protein n=1 Tax=Chlorogloeopsis sp. ULAP02 TaxID=3107926 RepID=UPI003135B3AD